MRSQLTDQELFGDRIELIGYATLAVSAALVIVYFAMMFFHPSVRYDSLASKFGTLVLLLSIAALAWWIPRYKNWARLPLVTIFLGAGLFSLHMVLDRGRWAYAWVTGYTYFGYWILSHPAAIAFFRPLSPREQRLQENTQTLFLIAAYYMFQAWYAFYTGAVTLMLTPDDMLYNPALGAGWLLWGAWLWTLLTLLRRGFAWSRWLMVATLSVAALILLPGTFSTHSYWAYWKALSAFFIPLVFALLLVFSPSAKKAFSHTEASPQKPKPASR